MIVTRCRVLWCSISVMSAVRSCSNAAPLPKIVTFVFIAAMIYLGLDKVKFIPNKPVKVIIACAVAFITVSMGKKYIIEIA